MMTSNILQCHGLCNSFTGVIFDIIYESDEFAPVLCKYVWVKFNEQYKVSTHLTNDESRCGWVLVHEDTKF